MPNEFNNLLIWIILPPGSLMSPKPHNRPLPRRLLIASMRSMASKGRSVVSHRINAFYSLIGSAKLVDTDPEAYLRHVLEHIADHPINRINFHRAFVIPVRSLIIMLKSFLTWGGSSLKGHFVLSLIALSFPLLLLGLQ
jgi:hypothetical protein